MSDYVRGLRDRLGSGLLLLPSVSAIVRDEQGRLLLARHLDADAWVTPGGAVEPGETPAQAVIREAREETGLDVVPVELLGVYGGPDFHVTYSNGDVVAYVGTAFRCHIIGGELGADGTETSDARFFGEEAVAAVELAPFTRALLKRVLSNVPFDA
jgi:ADP-ribose pyrophosphatase YjhB (NUDIX family)